MDLDLDTLKHEILRYLETSGFSIFRSQPGILDGLPYVSWDSERHPDYQVFLEVAKSLGVKMILFASREFATSEIEEAIEQLEDCGLSREERREFEQRLRPARRYEGVTCSIEIAFDLQARMYVYEAQPDWYEEFLSVCDEIMVLLPESGENDEDGSMGGLYSNN